MAITDKTRKNLWAKSGNRCAFCKTELFASDVDENEFNIGEECHIISSKSNGPRYKEGLTDYDVPENLMLLCRNHHKQIDELHETYTEELLNYVKLNHEQWVQSTLNKAITNETDDGSPSFLTIVKTGGQLLNLLGSSYGTTVDYDEVQTEEEAELIGRVSQSLVDYLDLLEIVEPGEHPKLSLQMKDMINDLEANGYLLFGQKHVRGVKYGDKESTMVVTNFAIKRKDSPDIMGMVD